jgi:hypothetical protein
MTDAAFRLAPFPGTGVPDISITGKISLHNNIIMLHYLLAGKLEEILFPPKSVKPGRRDELWKMTCFEFFLAIKDQPRYWEFNLSPSGDWNIYCVDAYRRIGFRRETSIQRLRFEVQKGEDSLYLDALVDLNPILGSAQSLEVGITSIVQTTDGKESYWALAHPGSVADFHLRQSFILELEGEIHPSPESLVGG